jgi:hypothetical protein
MVIKAATLGLKTEEVPVRFYKDREGRESHHKRMGWISPWLAGWVNLKTMMMYAPHTFLTRPGALIGLFGLILTAALASGPFHVAGIGFDLHWMLLGLTLTTVGYSAAQLGILAELRHNLEHPLVRRLADALTWNRGTGIAALLVLAGLGCTMPLLVTWISHDLTLSEIGNLSVFGLLLVVLGFQTFCLTLLLQIFPPSGTSDDS